MARRIIFIPSVYESVNGVGFGLPCTDKRVRADFVETHCRRYPGWRLRTIVRRYRAWVRQEAATGRA